jgi:hypothetical protein
MFSVCIRRLHVLKKIRSLVSSTPPYSDAKFPDKDKIDREFLGALKEQRFDAVLTEVSDNLANTDGGLPMEVAITQVRGYSDRALQSILSRSYTATREEMMSVAIAAIRCVHQIDTARSLNS